MDSDLFTDLLSAAMSESGLIDLETSNNRPAQSQHVTTSHEPASVSVRTQLDTVQHPQFHTSTGSLRPLVAKNSADGQKGVHKIVLRPLPTGLQPSLMTRQLQPFVLQTTTTRQPLIQTNVTSSGRTSVAVVRPICPVLRTTIANTGSNIHNAASVSPGTIVWPLRNAGTVRLTTIPRQLTARLPTGDAGVSVQIRPRLTAAAVAPRTVALAAGNVIPQPRPTLIQTSVNLAPPRSSYLSTRAAVSAAEPRASSSGSAAVCSSVMTGAIQSSTASSRADLSTVLSADHQLTQCATVTVSASSSESVSSSSLHLVTSSQQPLATTMSSDNLTVIAATNAATGHAAADAATQSTCTTVTSSETEANADDKQVRYYRYSVWNIYATIIPPLLRQKLKLTPKLPHQAQLQFLLRPR